MTDRLTDKGRQARSQSKTKNPVLENKVRSQKRRTMIESETWKADRKFVKHREDFILRHSVV